MKILENQDCKVLTETKMRETTGGTDSSNEGFWYQVSKLAGEVLKGLTEVRTAVNQSLPLVTK